MKSLKGLLIIFLCLLAGGILRQIIPMPIPDVVYGMLVLLILFLMKIVKVEDVEKTSNALLENLGILFVPLSVSLITKFDILSSNLVKIMLVLIVTTFLTMGVTAKVVEMVQNKGGKNDR